MNRVEIKEKAKKLISNNLWNLWKPLLIILAVNIVLSLILSAIFPSKEYYEYANDAVRSYYNIGDTIGSLLMAPLYVGYIVYLLNFIRGKKFEIKDIFSKMNYVLPIWAVTFLVSLFTGIGLIFLIVPGIIISLMLAIVNYIMADMAEMKITDTMKILKQSKEMMDGHKWDYFVFGLSFIGWWLLVGITFGIAIIYVGPYMSTSMALYYEELKKIKK